jgi:N-acetylmuramoyl-L-alanine amidase
MFLAHRLTLRHAFCLMVVLLVPGHNAGFAADLYYHSREGSIVKFSSLEISDPVSSLEALARPPLGGSDKSLRSAIPAGTRVLAIAQDEATTSVELSSEILSLGLDDQRLSTMAEQVRLTLEQFGTPGSIRLTTGGRLLSDYLPPKRVVGRPEGQVPQVTSLGVAGSLAGKSVSLSPGHGKRWIGTYYAFERPVYCAPLSCEDDHNLEIMNYLNQYLIQDGAVTKVYRCLDKNYGTHAGSGEPWWRMSAGYWLKLLGYPCSVYASLTGDCTLGTGASESDDSLRSRGLASDYDGTDIYVSLHSNGASGDCTSSCPNGTCTYYDTSTEHAAWGAVSKTLAAQVNASIINAIRTRYPDSTWTDRGALDANGTQAETRIPDRAAVLIELAFHDSCLRDAACLRDNFFRSTTMWATYKGICDYFGVTPGWDYYSYEILSDDIPPVLAPGATAGVHITLRNRGVLWNDARQFRLGAVGDSDPFTATTRYNMGAEIGPGQTKTFTLNLKAPETPGLYTTDWRMVRESVTWFGPALTRNILVSTNGDGEAPTVPAGLAASAPAFNQVDLGWRAATDNVEVRGYNIFRDGALLANSRTTNYSDVTCASATTYAYQVSALDASGNESAPSSTVQITTPPQLDWILDNTAGIPSGSWSTGTASTDKYLTDYRFKDTATTETGSFKWSPTIERPGFYDLFVWYPQGSNRCTNSPYRIGYAGGSTVVTVNQTTGGGAWRSLGPSRPFIRGTNGWVQLGNATVEPGKVVLADAVRFTYASALPSLPLLQQNLSGNTLTLAWANPYCVLQRASSLPSAAADWTDVPRAGSPYQVDVTATPRQFYRLRY